MGRKKKLEIVFEGGKWLVKGGGVVMARFGSEDTAKAWVKEQSE